jgi:ABC-type transport system substrate-binding protein
MMLKPRLALIALPLTVLLLMAQSVLWVPTYDTLGRDNPARLHSFVETSIGDARLLNPILMADVASARITDLVFDGLLRIDDRLQLQGALATRWQVSERVYVLLENTLDPALAAAAAQRIITERDPHLLTGPIIVHPPSSAQREIDVANGTQTVAAKIAVPQRLELPLSRVEPQIERWIAAAITPMPLLQRRKRVDATAQSLSDAQIGQLLPAVEHNPQITFWLREDVRFHDGHLLDAGDVVFTWQAIMDTANRSPNRASFEPVKTVVAVSEHVVRVVYKRLFSPAVNIWTMGILPEHLLNDAALRREADTRTLTADARRAFGMRDSRFNRHPIGTGAFRFQRWSSDELIHLSRNDNYRHGVGNAAPLFRDYYFRIIPDTLTQEIEFRSGAADSYQAEPHQAARYRRDERYRAFSAILPGYTYIGYNQRKAPFDDVRVRTALGMAIDVDSIIRYALFDEGERVTGPFASITHWYDRSVPKLAHDRDAASALLREAGWSPDAEGWLRKDGKRLEFNLITNNGNLRRKAIATIVQQAWRQIGVKCNVQLFEWAVFLKDFINPGQFDAVILGWRLDLNPDLYQLWHSSQSGPNQLNFVAFSDARSDQLIEQMRREYDRDKQIRIAHELHRRIAGLQPYTFLFAPRSTRLLDRKIVMRDDSGAYEPVRAGGAGDLFYHMNRWLHLAHDPGF